MGNIQPSNEVALGDPISQLFARGLTDREVAIICSVSPGAVWRWRKNLNGVSRSKEKAAEAYLYALLLAESKTPKPNAEPAKIPQSLEGTKMNNITPSKDAEAVDAVSQLFAKGMTDRQIASICDCTPNAVNRWRHKRNGIASTKQRAAEAYLHGIVMAESETKELLKQRRAIADERQKLEEARAEAKKPVEIEAPQPKTDMRFHEPSVRIAVQEPGDLSYLVMISPDKQAKFEKVMGMFGFEFVDFDLVGAN